MDGLESLSRPFLLLNVLLSYVDDVVHATGDNIDLWLPSICIVIGQWTLDIPGPQIATNTCLHVAACDRRGCPSGGGVGCLIYETPDIGPLSLMLRAFFYI